MAAAWDDVVQVLRVEIPEVLLGHSDHCADLVEMEVAPYLEGVHLGRHPDLLGHDSVVLAVGHRVHGAHECRNIASGLPGKEGIDAPEVPAASSPPDRLRDVARAAVVCADRQRPVTEDLVCVTEVACGGVDRFLEIVAFVHIGIDFQPVAPGRAVHELPHSAGSGPGPGHRVQHGLDYRHVLELDGKAVAHESLLEYREIILAHSQHPAHLSAHLLRIEYDVVLHDVVVGQRYEGVHVGKPLLYFAVGDVGYEFDGIHVVFVHRVEIAREGVFVPQVQQAVRDFRCVFRQAVLYGFRGIAFDYREKISFQRTVAGFQAVDQELQRVHLGLEPVVFGAELLAGRAPEPVCEGLGLKLQASGEQDYCQEETFHRQKLNPSLRPIAGLVAGLPNASWLSGNMTVGDMFIDRSSVTSKLCM